MIIVGARTMRIKRFRDRDLVCPNCGEYTREFNVYKQYFHIFFIPVFPVSSKQITSHCCSCGHQSNEKMDFYLKQTRTPLYLFTGLFLIVALVIFGGIENHKEQKLKQEYIANPAIGDVYLFYNKAGEEKGYYFTKITDIKEDTLFMVFNRFIYSKFVSDFDDEDYFDLDNNGYALKKDVQEYLDLNIINSVERGYKADSKFNIEKNSEDDSVDI